MATEEHQIDNYKLNNCIATGSVSQIWEVSDAGSSSRHAMKLLLPEAFRVSAEKAMLKQEFKIASSFDHPNLIRAVGHIQNKEHAYYLMEFFGSPNVKQLVRGNLVTLQSKFKRLAECVALALGHMHTKGWAHKDVKPDNMLLSRGGEVRLIDFNLATRLPGGLGKLLGGKEKTIQGTRTYIAPEIIRKKPADEQSDIYSFGVTLFECLTGRPPFMGGSPNDLLAKHIREKAPAPSDFNPNVTPQADRFIEKMMAKDPARRQQGIGELLGELRELEIFKEDPAQLAADNITKQEAADLDGISERLDSRTDAKRTEKRGGAAPPQKPETQKAPEKIPHAPKQPEPPKPVAQPPQNIPPQNQPPQAQPPQVQPPMGNQGQIPQQPQYHPQQVPYQQPYAPQIPQQQPGYPPNPNQQPIAPQIPQQRPVSPPPQAPQPKKTPPPPQVPPPNDDDLPFADELPDIV